MTGRKYDVLSKATVNLLNDVDCQSSVHVISEQDAVNNKTLCSTSNPYALLDNVRNFKHYFIIRVFFFITYF